MGMTIGTDDSPAIRICFNFSRSIYAPHTKACRSRFVLIRHTSVRTRGSRYERHAAIRFSANSRGNPDARGSFCANLSGVIAAKSKSRRLAERRSGNITFMKGEKNSFIL